MDEVTRLIPLDDQSQPKRRVMSVTDLITECNESAAKMSVHNSHRVLLMNCAYALRQLVDRLAFHENQTKVT